MRVISALNLSLLDHAIAAVSQARAAETQAVRADQSAAQQADRADVSTAKQAAVTAKFSGGGAKQAGKPKAKPKTPASSPAEKSTITPYLTADDLMQANAVGTSNENAVSDANMGFSRAAADALHGANNVEQQRVQNVSAANWDAGSRGIYASGIRQGNVGMANANAARSQAGLNSNLALAAAAAVGQRRSAEQNQAGFMQGMVAKAAENGAALPVDPYDNGGGNVKGAVTKRKVPRVR